MRQNSNGILIPFTILDAMILIAIVAVGLHVFRHDPVRHRDLRPAGVEGWGKIAESVVQVPAFVGPLVVLIQFFRGRTHRLFPGELAWLMCAITPMLLAIGLGFATRWALFEWTWPEWHVVKPQPAVRAIRCVRFVAVS